MNKLVHALALTLAAFPSLALADPPPEKLVIATWNVEWFYDNYAGDNYADLAKQQSAPSRPDWDWKLAGVADVIQRIKPTILCLQEIENQRVLFYLTRKLKQDYGLDYTVAYIEGGDFFTEQDVAVLALSGLTEYSVKRQTAEMFASKEYYNVTKHIFCQFEWGSGADTERLTLVNVHLRAQPEATEIRKKQGKLIRRWIDGAVKGGENLIVIGDVNTDETFETTTSGGDIGTLRGLDTPASDDDLGDLFAHYKGESKETHLVHKQFDHILTTPSLEADAPGKSDLVFKSIAIHKDLVVRGQQQDADHMDIFWKIPQDERDVSDHYPVVAEFEFKR
ncbi:MAG: endonuclease/exonuclease/phosphatase family protein [Planctomycetaceae bacterium]|nr:endonuclease/exonuclease/phosphatase family protein [Planctomycetaceae bacterium]